MDATSPAGEGGLREELRGDAATLADTAKNRVHSEVDTRKGAVVEQAQTLSSALGKAAEEMERSPDWLKSAFRQGAEAVQRLSDSIENKDSRQLTREAQQLARDNPGVFLAGCAALGFAAARVMRAGVDSGSDSPSRQSPGSSASSDDDRSYDPYGSSTVTGSSPAFAGLETRSEVSGALQGAS